MAKERATHAGELCNPNFSDGERNLTADRSFPSVIAGEPWRKEGIVMGVEGTRVIIVEDEALLALDMEDQVTEAGCIVAGSAATIDQAMDLARTADFHVALLDMNLGGERIDPVARLIAARGMPVIFITGYGQRTLPPGIAAPVLDKPCTMEKLLPLIVAARERFCA